MKLFEKDVKIRIRSDLNHGDYKKSGVSYKSSTSVTKYILVIWNFYIFLKIDIFIFGSMWDRRRGFFISSSLPHSSEYSRMRCCQPWYSKGNLPRQPNLGNITSEEYFFRLNIKVGTKSFFNVAFLSFPIFNVIFLFFQVCVKC